jgi:two-component system, cell cycle sensor histidine kinase and response regulator CckA
LLYARPNADETSLSNVGQILKAAERSRTLIRQLLAFGRKQELRIEVVDLNQVLAEMHSMLRPLLNASIELRVLSTDQPEYAEIDKSQFQQVMMNLAMNAGDAMPDGGVLTIALRESVANSDQEKLETSRESVLLTVTDTGTGIDDSIKSKIFEPFFTTKEQSGGMGLGLAMVYGIVKQNQGDIAVESKPGEGTTFFLRFPRAGKPASSKSEKVIAGSVAALHGTVLLAEDRGDLREMLAEILTRNGLHVLVAFDGENAIEIASETEENIDLVVSDVMMPRMNGPDAVRRIRVSRPTVKAIYLSGYTELGIAEENDILIAKPVTPEALMQAINNCLVGTPPPSLTGAPRKKMAA